MKGKSLLVDGLIPKGQACPFLNDCGLKVGRCPTEATPKTVDYSCAAARLHDMCQAK